MPRAPAHELRLAGVAVACETPESSERSQLVRIKRLGLPGAVFVPGFLCELRQEILRFREKIVPLPLGLQLGENQGGDRFLFGFRKLGCFRERSLEQSAHGAILHRILASPIFDELRSIFLKTSGLADPIRDALKPLASKIELAFIYGSVARNEAHAGSDVDLMVVACDVTLEKLFARLAPAEGLLARRINPTLYTPEEFRKRVRTNPFVQKVISGPTISLIGTIDAQEGAREPR